MESNRLEHSDVVLKTHEKDRCHGETCTIHNMSDHDFRPFPQVWFNNTLWREVMVPGLGPVLYVDPDDPKYIESRAVPEEETELLLNSVQCLVCEEVLVSYSRHDYVECECVNHAMTDGGNSYIRRGAVDMSKLKDLSKYETRLVVR